MSWPGFSAQMGAKELCRSPRKFRLLKTKKCSVLYTTGLEEVAVIGNGSALLAPHDAHSDLPDV